MCQVHKKLVEGKLWAEATGVTMWGHMKILPGMCPVIRDHICLGVIFHSVAFLHLEVVRGHDFWTHLQMCLELVDLLAPILDNGTVSGEMGS